MKLDATEGDAGERWKVIKELLHADERDACGDAVENQHVCDSFCSFFENWIKSIATKIKGLINAGAQPSKTVPTYAKSGIPDIFSPVNDKEANNAICNTGPKKSPMDYIPTAKLTGYGDVVGRR